MIIQVIGRRRDEREPGQSYGGVTQVILDEIVTCPGPETRAVIGVDLRLRHQRAGLAPSRGLVHKIIRKKVSAAETNQVMTCRHTGATGPMVTVVVTTRLGTGPQQRHLVTQIGDQDLELTGDAGDGSERGRSLREVILRSSVITVTIITTTEDPIIMLNLVIIATIIIKPLMTMLTCPRWTRAPLAVKDPPAWHSPDQDTREGMIPTSWTCRGQDTTRYTSDTSSNHQCRGQDPSVAHLLPEPSRWGTIHQATQAEHTPSHPSTRRGQWAEVTSREGPRLTSDL